VLVVARTFELLAVLTTAGLTVDVLFLEPSIGHSARPRATARAVTGLAALALISAVCYAVGACRSAASPSRSWCGVTVVWLGCLGFAGERCSTVAHIESVASERPELRAVMAGVVVRADHLPLAILSDHHARLLALRR